MQTETEKKELQKFRQSITEGASQINRRDLLGLLMTITLHLRVVENEVKEDLEVARYRGEFRRYRKQLKTEAKEDKVLYLVEREV